jgi:hypothetical protein
VRGISRGGVGFLSALLVALCVCVPYNKPLPRLIFFGVLWIVLLMCLGLVYVS